MAFTEVSMKLGFCSLFLNEELSSIFGIDLLAATQTNSESGGDVSQIRAQVIENYGHPRCNNCNLFVFVLQAIFRVRFIVKDVLFSLFYVSCE